MAEEASSTEAAASSAAASTPEAFTRSSSSRLSLSVGDALTQTLQVEVDGLRRENKELTQELLEFEERAAASSAQALAELSWTHAEAMKAHEQALRVANERISALEADHAGGSSRESERVAALEADVAAITARHDEVAERCRHYEQERESLELASGEQEREREQERAQERELQALQDRLEQNTVAFAVATILAVPEAPGARAQMTAGEVAGYEIKKRGETLRAPPPAKSQWTDALLGRDKSSAQLADATSANAPPVMQVAKEARELWLACFERMQAD
eukprot:5386711-Prymnesium_polylepis.1